MKVMHRKRKFQPYSLQEQIPHLRSLNRRERLALFLGAGVSVGCGLPDWDGLLNALSQRVGLNPDIERDQIADLARRRLGNAFNETVADCLYEGGVIISDSLRRIARSGIRRVATFNFDDLLEETLQTENIEHKIVLNGEPFNNNYSGTIVFHPHGILERFMNTAEHQGCSIILANSDYESLYRSPYCLTNLIQLSLIINFSILFVGMSITDPNTLRLLETARGLGVRHWHYAILLDPGDGTVAEKTAHFRRMGIDPVWIKDFSAIPHIFRDIRVRRYDRSQKS